MKWTIALAVLVFSGCAKTSAPPTSVAAAPATSPSVATKASASASETPKVSCKRGKEIRTLEVTQKSPGYLLDYEKLGKMITVSKSPIGLNQCMQVEKKIEKKLEHAGFTCT
jgi:hypothetical protein